PWPIRVVSSGPAFGPDGFIEWVGFGLDTLYTKTNVYTLRVDPATARRVIEDTAPVSVAPAATTYRAKVHTERNRSYSFGSPIEDPWYDTGILAFTVPVSANFTFRTDDRVPGTGAVTLAVSLWGVTDWAQAPDHHVVLSVNGTELADTTFDGLSEQTISFEVPEAVLLGGDNTLTVTLPGDTGVDFDMVNVESWTVSYERQLRAIDGALELEAAGEVFEISALPSADVAVYRHTEGHLERLANVQILGAPGDYSARFRGTGDVATYYVASGPIGSPLLEPGRAEADLIQGSAELLIVSHPDFLTGLAPLASHRRSQGWSVKVVDVEDVYEQFGFGVFDPQAIRDYIDFARQNLGSRAVLLVGGDTYDYHDNLGLGSVSFIPSIYARTGDFVRFAPADGLLADGDGDEVPDVAIGRFPVRTTGELATLIDKTLRYERLADRRTLVMAADDYDAPSRFDFTLSSEQLVNLTPVDWHVEPLYIDQLGVVGARERLLERLNEGPAVTSFMGHSGPTTWSFDGLFNATDATTLGNVGAPTVVAQWGCWTTYYVSPQNETLGHQLLLSGDRGAAAVLGATTLTEARSERALSLEVFARLFQPGRTLGDAVLQAKQALAATESPAVLDVLLGWNLLGDPTLVGFDGATPPGPSEMIFSDGFETGDSSAWATR
ncbi:MAG: C25 family cysteine peptidase, partial [Acidobacteriota bacterium]